MARTRRRASLRARVAIALVSGAIATVGAFASARPSSADAPSTPRSANSARSHARPEPQPVDARPRRAPVPRLPADFQMQDAALRDGRYVVDLANGARAELTVDPALQAHVERELARYEVPHAGLVAIDPRDGRVLAMVSRTTATATSEDFARIAEAPSASVFKIITAAALLDRGVEPSRRVCYGGGLHGLSLRDLADDPERDSRCATLAEAMGSSINAVFAKLADRHLDRGVLARYADAFAFGQTLPVDVRTAPSAIDLPADRLEFARTAAGFWHAYLSPMHGALVASTVAAGGVMPRAALVERVVAADGRELARFEPGAHRSVVGAATARQLTAMMERTVASGTARSAFFDPEGRPFLPGIRVAGKTGTLTRERPEYRGYTWFVGFAPADNPRIAVAALVVNTPAWRIKASYLAREALRQWLVVQRR